MKSKNVWDELPKPFYVLAPMEAVTDVVFRHVVAKAGDPDLWFSEFTNATGWVHAGDKAIRGRLFKTDDEQPIIAQIWGGEPGDMEKLAAHCKELGFDAIDINMGCPVKSAIKSGGSALIRKPEVAIAAIKAAKTAGLPVSVKTRLGYTSVDEWKVWLRTLLEQDIAALTIHLRTKKEMSKVPAHWEVMDEIVALRNEIAPHTKIIGNGDIENKEEGAKRIATHRLDGVMIGRGIFHNPYAFADNSSDTRSKDELLDLLQTHLDLYDQYEQKTTRPYDTLKRFYKIYVRDFEGASVLRDKLMHTNSTNDVRELIAQELQRPDLASEPNIAKNHPSAPSMSLQ
jgi:tRNA-dihydrouridine synthase